MVTSLVRELLWFGAPGQRSRSDGQADDSAVEPVLSSAAPGGP